MSATDDLLANNEAYAASFDKADVGKTPAKRVTVLACMDTRLNVYAMLGLAEGDAHVIRNAGGLVTDDAIRSIAISQRALGTEEVVVIHHTDCGALSLPDDELRRQLEADTGVSPPWALDTSGDLEANVRRSLARIAASPFVPHKDAVRGFVYEVESGRLREVS